MATNVPRSVLVAVDFGDASARAVAVAGTVAERCQATLRLLHAEAMEAPPYFTADQVQQLERQRASLRAQAEDFLSRFGRQHTRHPFTVGVDNPPAADAILRHASAADLVVMGTHGRHGPRRWWLGSVAERVLRDVERPLLIVRADTTQPATVFDRALVHAAAPLTGATALRVARELGAVLGGTTIDGRCDLIEPAINRTRATILVVEMPAPRTASWLTNYGEPLVRFCTVPILFIPEAAQGASS